MNNSRLKFGIWRLAAPPAIVACLELLWNIPFARLPVYWIPLYSPFPAIFLNTTIHIAITCLPAIILGWVLACFRPARRVMVLFWFFLTAVYAIYMSWLFLRLLWEIRDDPVFYSALITFTVCWVGALIATGVIMLRPVLRSPVSGRTLAWPATLILSSVVAFTSLVLRRPLTGLWQLVAWAGLICGAHIVVRLLTRGWRPGAGPLAAGLLLITITLTFARSFWASGGGAPERPHIVVSLWDATRADRLSAYGYRIPTTPFAEKLASRGVVWRRLYSSANFTFPSHVSIFTGLYNSEHNLWASSAGYQEFSSLPGELARRGYRTILITENPWVMALNRGFDFYSAPFTRRMSVHWDKNPYRARPFPPFPTALTLPSPFLARRLIDTIRHRIEGWYKFSIDDYQLRLVGEQLLLRRRDRPVFLFLNWMNVHNRYYPGPEYRTGEEVDPYPIREEYDNAVRYADRRLASLAALIDRAGLTGETIYVLTSDHGQMHGEQTIWGHGRTLFDPVLRVPLLVSSSAWEGRREVPYPVTQVSMKEMVIALAEEDYHSPAARDRIIGVMSEHRGVVAELRDDEPREDGSFRQGFTYLDREGAKIIYDPQLSDWESPWGDADTLVFDLSADPAETGNLLESRPEMTRRLLELYEQWENSISRPLEPGSPARFPPGLEKQLRALGYLQ